MTTINGSSGSDILSGTSGADSISGGGGNDIILAGSGNDSIDGGGGNDIILAGSGNDSIDGGGGNDVILAGSGNDVVSGGAGNDFIDGGSGNDVISGGDGKDVIDGGSGNDSISGGDGKDVIDGGSGNDSLSGGNGNDVLSGSAGNDMLRGNDGNDTLIGGAGADQLTGGGGNDTFVYLAASDSRTGSLDCILDFTQGSDKIDLTAFRGFHDLNWSGTTAGTMYGVWFVNHPDSGSSTGSSTSINADTNGDGIADVTIELKNTPASLQLTSADFIGVNQALVAVADMATTVEDHSTVINVLANDRGSDNDGQNDHDECGDRDDDGHGDKIFLTGVTNGAHGTVMVNDNGTVTYIPNADFNGIDSFTYTISDRHGGTDTGTVAVTVTKDSDVANDALTTAEDTAITANVLAGTNGASADNFEGAATLAGVTQGAHGAVTFAADGIVTYTPDADYNGSDSFTYTVANGGANETETVNVTVTKDSDVANDALTTAEDTAITANVLTGTNGASADNFEGAATLASVTQGAHGAVTFAADGTVTYTPDADYNGSDSFTYTVANGGANETATVNVTASAVSDVANDALTTSEDTAITANVLTGSNGASADNFEGAASLAGVTQGAHGAVTFAADGTVTYTPDADYNGSDSFTYTVANGGANETATVNVTASAVSDVANDALTTAEDTAITANVLAGTNGASADNFEGAARLASVTQGAHGAVTFAANGMVTYTPDADYNGSDSFTYTVANGGANETATVNVMVRDVTDIVHDSATTDEDTAVNILVQDNDSFENPAHAIAEVTQGTHGTVAINDNGTPGTTDDYLVYTPDADYNGSDSFSYRVSSNGTTETTTVNVMVNAVQDAFDDNASTAKNTPVNILVQLNDTFENPAHAITSWMQGTHGSVAINDNGTAGSPADDFLVYTPGPDYDGSDSFSYTVTSNGTTETATVTLGSHAVDAMGDSVLTNISQGNHILIPGHALLVNDTDTLDHLLNIASVTNAEEPDKVKLTNGDVDYYVKDPLPGSFDYTASDGMGGRDSAHVTVVMQEGNFVTGDSSSEILIASDDGVQLNSGGGNDFLVGGAGVDFLTGDSGNDTLAGGGGNDFLISAGGNDIFDYNALSDADAGTAGDFINDFIKGSDKLDVHDLLSTFKGIAPDHSNAFADGYLKFTPSDDNLLDTLVQVDTDGTGGVDSFHTLATISGVTLTPADTGDFIL